MANVASAEKRNRQRLKRRVRNIHHLTTTRSAVKKAVATLKGKDLGAVKLTLAEASSQLNKAAQKGVIKKKTASRKISRLAKAQAKKAAAAAAPK